MSALNTASKPMTHPHDFFKKRRDFGIASLLNADST